VASPHPPSKGAPRFGGSGLRPTAAVAPMRATSSPNRTEMRGGCRMEGDLPGRLAIRLHQLGWLVSQLGYRHNTVDLGRLRAEHFPRYCSRFPMLVQLLRCPLVRATG
jgi:hypothetical protein